MASGLQKPKPEPEANLGQVVGLAWPGSSQAWPGLASGFQARPVHHYLRLRLSYQQWVLRWTSYEGCTKNLTLCLPELALYSVKNSVIIWDKDTIRFSIRIG